MEIVRPEKDVIKTARQRMVSPGKIYREKVAKETKLSKFRQSIIVIIDLQTVV